MSEQDAAAEVPPAAPTAPAAAKTPQMAAEISQQETPETKPEKKLEETPKDKVTVDTAAAEAEAKKPAGKRKAGDDTASTPRKRRTPSPRANKKPKDAEGEDTESEPEKQPKQKRAKTAAKGAKRGPKPGRRKKAAEPEEDEEKEQRQVEHKVAALSDEIKGRFGQIVWAKMGGYPYWPCIITDPRLLPKKLQDSAMKVLETKYLVFFYVSNNFAPISFKMIESWDDTKFNYREGYPEKDSKAPKRRVKLMAAIEVADKETKLPIEDRADGLLKPEEKTEEVEEPADETPAPVKRKPGRPPKNKTVPRKSQTARKSKGKDEENETGQAADGNARKEAAPATRQEEEEDSAGPTLSKEEIKAKVASRKTPKKKGAEESANAAGGSAKKAPKATVKHAKSNGSEIDSKRKKEIELVVPHKTVKSADIREMTEEAAKKKLSGPKSKAKKDKGEYKVGDLALYASKMARLQAKESARNNDELVTMMQELFKETLMYRSDVERSGLAAIIAILRKSLSPTVGQTASGLRKHMINILKNDTEITHLGKKGHHDAVGHGTKKRKAENGSSVKSEKHQQKKTTEVLSTVNGDANENSVVKEKVSSPPAEASPAKKAEDVSPKETKAKVKEEKTPIKPVEDVAAKPAPSKNVAKKVEDAAAGKVKASTEKTEEANAATDKEKANVTTDKPASPTKVAEKELEAAVKDTEDMFESPEYLDKNRKIFVDMLSKILDHDGSTRADLAKEIEAALFERFKESSDDYLTQARIIIFGLKENAPMRQRLFSGALHCLEFAYADDAFFKTTE